MQRLSIGSPGASRPRLDAAAEEEDEKAAGKAGRAALAPDKSIHLVPLLTLLCLLVLFLFSHDPASSAIADSPPVLAVAARSLEATADTMASVARGGALKADPVLRRGRRLGATPR
ncbi:uncharacterized protein LOC100824920 [Brachypodium distachyon]|uniref:Uncharacterized protein n=1 Tax=Brachypodium distachyon TaxID=15368 RepID=A0A0Q3FEE0_BRADI|nr:uncharacterized protein LOC100824920 [Brachypodium distachyon]KQJ97967.1 hypothetical protein BRADI_3g34375v3 [Brachypodium distachyon]|eukprot:XP_010235047.1 uncharacterized protein LOC100824920 [Brachypodium distachyon]